MHAPGIGVNDIDAAGKGDHAVHDQDLPMISVENVHCICRAEGIEFHCPDAAVPQALKERWWRAETTCTVIDEIDLNTFRPFLEKKLGQMPTGFIISKTERLQVYVIFGALDGTKHGCVNIRAVSEQRHLVPGYERKISDGSHKGDVLLHKICATGLSLKSMDDGLSFFIRKRASGIEDFRGTLQVRHFLDYGFDIRQSGTCSQNG